MKLPQVFRVCLRNLHVSIADKQTVSFLRMATTSTKSVTGDKPLSLMIAVCQMTSTGDKEANFTVCQSLIKNAALRGAQMVFLPEACDYIAESKDLSVQMAEPLDGDLVSRYCNTAKQYQLWLSVGGFHQKGPDRDPKRVYNTHIIIDKEGTIRATYCKSHLFDLDLQGRVRLCESDYTVPGQRIVPPVATPVGNIGLSTYDVRFPELSILLSQLGADILTFPSAFTQTTGMAHWEVLLRARAIENQCYVVAAAQTGSHNAKRTSYGHAMIIDPWGTVLAQCREGTDLAVAEVDLAYLARIRQDMPVWKHRRHDLYSQVISLQCTSDNIDSQAEYQFGHVSLESRCVFARSHLSFAFVNLKPVVPGHMLVASLRPAAHLSDLTQAEVSDLFSLVQQVSVLVKNEFKSSAVTVALQDGPDAGQTIHHVHIHILPRRPGDFEQNDGIYYELQKHDRDLSSKPASLRSREQMAEEAAMMRDAIRRRIF